MKKIFNKLVELSKNAYCPYSKFKVSAIAKSNNNYYYGVNVESAAFPSGNCAEKNAISSSITNGNKTIDELYIYSDTEYFISPCGNCRQFMSEFMVNDETKIYVFNVNGEYKEFKIIELLPYRFTSKELKKGK